jgi:hypothetical protein
MSRLVLLLTVFVARVLIPYAECQAAEPKPAMRGVLVGIDRISPGFLGAWKSKGVNAIVVPLDDAAKQRWRPMAEAVERAGMTLWPWIEVARNPLLAAAHPDWMAAIGGHHDDCHPGKVIIPVWVTECELTDLPDAKDGTGLCGHVRCAANDCWPRYARNWNPLLKATSGPIALGVWSETFRRDACGSGGRSG